MKKLMGVLVMAGAMISFSFGPAVRAQQEPEKPQSWKEFLKQQREAEERKAKEEGQVTLAPQKDRLLKRGDVLMPNDPLLVKMAEHQERSQRQYKAMTFEQTAIIERYKASNKLQKKERVSKHREIVARYAPDGRGELQASLISDTDKKAWQKHLKEKKTQEAEKREAEEAERIRQSDPEAYEKYLKKKSKRGSEKEEEREER